MRLDEKAMNVHLHISQWQARKYDRKLSQEIASQYQADSDVGRYNKVIIAREAIKVIGRVVNEARTYHYDHTLPWLDNGARILPAKMFDEYSKRMREFHGKFDAEVGKFISNYPDLIEQARIELNGMFNGADYPLLRELEYKFKFDMYISPIPAAGDFRVDLNQDEVEKIRKSVEDRVKRAEQIATKDLWSRLHEAIGHMADKLTKSDTVFRDSLVNNLCELVNLLPMLNINEDPELERMRREVESRLCVSEPQELRDDLNKRQAAKQAADELLNQMSGYIGG